MRSFFRTFHTFRLWELLLFGSNQHEMEKRGFYQLKEKQIKACFVKGEGNETKTKENIDAIDAMART